MKKTNISINGNIVTNSHKGALIVTQKASSRLFNPASCNRSEIRNYYKHEQN